MCELAGLLDAPVNAISSAKKSTSPKSKNNHETHEKHKIHGELRFFPDFSVFRGNHGHFGAVMAAMEMVCYIISVLEPAVRHEVIITLGITIWRNWNGFNLPEVPQNH